MLQIHCNLAGRLTEIQLSVYFSRIPETLLYLEVRAEIEIFDHPFF